MSLIPFEVRDGDRERRFLLTEEQMAQVSAKVHPVHLAALEEFGTEVEPI